MYRHSVPPLVIVACFVLVAAVPGNAQLLELTVEPTRGTLDQTFMVRIANRGTEDFRYEDCCPFPRITALASGQTLPLCIECEPCPPEPLLGGVLPAGAALEHRWRPEDATCVEDWTPTPGIYEVRWTGFPEYVNGRFELLPDPARALELSANPPEGRIGEPIQILAQNTATSTPPYLGCITREESLLIPEDS